MNLTDLNKLINSELTTKIKNTNINCLNIHSSEIIKIKLLFIRNSGTCFLVQNKF